MNLVELLGVSLSRERRDFPRWCVVVDLVL